MLADLLNEYPEVIAILLVVLGFVLAGVVARLVEQGATRFQASLVQRSNVQLETRDLDSLFRGLRAFAYYGTLLVFALLALQTLSVSVIRDWLSLALEHVPQLILGGLIILFGYLLAVMVRNIIAGLMGVSQQHLAPRIAQGLVFIAAVLTGLAQTAINVSFLTDIVIILIAFFFGGLAGTG